MSITGSAESIEQLEKRVRIRLANSLDSVWRQAGSKIITDPDARSNLLDKIRERQQHPRVFARYYDLTLALLDSRIAEAQQISDGLLSLSPQTMRFAVRPFSEDELGEDFERFPRLLFSEQAVNSPMATPAEEQFSTKSRQLSEARELISEVDPEMAREIQVLWPRIYLARPNRESEFQFAGVTSFMVWGATFMNVEAFDSLWQVVQFLVHESTHAILFALGCDDALVKNPAKESYASPLRPDPRPMDGIYHATVVCARMAEFNRRSLELGVIDVADSTYVEDRLPEIRESYEAGRKIIREHGILSATAEALLHRCDQALSAGA